jgi:hypothetical protein
LWKVEQNVQENELKETFRVFSKDDEGECGPNFLIFLSRNGLKGLEMRKKTLY